nr:type IV secretion system DNA-binding domain-containing protein [Roseomonas nepalensis]
MTPALRGRWFELFEQNYQSRLLLATLPGALVMGGVMAMSRASLRNLWLAPAAWAVGGGLGLAAAYLLALPDVHWHVLAPAGLALLLAFVATLIVAPNVDTTNVVRGVKVVMHDGDSRQALKEASRKGQTALAAVVLPAAAETGHIMCAGTTGAGKSVANMELLTTALHRGDRVVAVDADGSAMSRLYLPGDVILNPFDARGARWCILSEIEQPSDFKHLADCALTTLGGSAEWMGYGRDIFAACLETWHQNQLGSSDAFFRTLATAKPAKLALLCEGTAAHRYFEEGAERLTASTLGVISENLRALGLAASGDGEPFSVRRFIREGTGSLWIPYRADQTAAMRRLASCWMRLALNEALSLPDSRTRRLWFNVDELDGIGRIEDLKDALVRLRKKGGCVFLGFQSIAQLRKLYDAEANTIVENCNTKLFLRCHISEGGGTAKFASEVIGDRTVSRQESTETVSSNGRSTTRREHRTDERMVLPAEITQLPDLTGYLWVAGSRNWLLVTYQYLDWPERVAPWVPRSFPPLSAVPSDPSPVLPPTAGGSQAPLRGVNPSQVQGKDQGLDRWDNGATHRPAAE